jgi:ribosomal protein S18 acetylase RimI-like enzyme
MPSLTIRRGAPDDAVALARLAERTFRETFGADNTPGDMAQHCAASYSPAIQLGELARADIDTIVCADGSDQLIAYAQLRPGAPPIITGLAPIELWRFYVDRAHHGLGIAQRLMAAVFETARERSAETLWLGVWERNHRAQAFYRKIGFVDVGAHEFRLGNDIQTDRIMALSLIQR